MEALNWGLFNNDEEDVEDDEVVEFSVDENILLLLFNGFCCCCCNGFVVVVVVVLDGNPFNDGGAFIANDEEIFEILLDDEELNVLSFINGDSDTAVLDIADDDLPVVFDGRYGELNELRLVEEGVLDLWEELIFVDLLASDILATFILPLIA